MKGFSREARDALIKHDYPGNVRELENIVERAVVLSRGEYITREDLSIFGAAEATACGREHEAGGRVDGEEDDNGGPRRRQLGPDKGGRGDRHQREDVPVQDEETGDSEGRLRTYP